MGESKGSAVPPSTEELHDLGQRFARLWKLKGKTLFLI